MRNCKLIITLYFTILIGTNVHSQILNQKWPSIIRNTDGAWFATNEAKQVAENVLLYQRNIGGWPKNIQMQNPLNEDEKQKLIALKSDLKEITLQLGNST